MCRKCSGAAGEPEKDQTAEDTREAEKDAQRPAETARRPLPADPRQARPVGNRMQQPQ